MFCNEGVFRIVLNIYLKNQDEFFNLISKLGGLHMTKCVLYCIDKFIKGSGLDDVLIETGGFGAKVLEAVLGKTRYVRSFREMLILSSAIFSLKWSPFSEIIKDDQFNEINEKVKELSSNLIQKNNFQGYAKYEECEREIDLLKSKYDMFVKDRASSSEFCKYWDLILKFINLLKQLIAAEREGNWNTYVCTVQELLPLFRAANSINYL